MIRLRYFAHKIYLYVKLFFVVIEVSVF